MNYYNQKIRRTLTHDIQKHWTAVSTLLGLISSVYRNLHYRRSNQRPQIVEPKLHNWETVHIAHKWRQINSNVSCKPHPHSLQRTRSPPRPRPPNRNGYTPPHNYCDLKDKGYFFKVEELYCELFGLIACAVAMTS